jgi:peptidyl-prolyl cis-trans isomerase C
MPKLIKEPLVQFLIGGIFLYSLLAVFSAPVTEEDHYIIPVNESALLRYLQFQDKAFDSGGAKAALAAMDTTARDRLKADYIRDEVLVREAISLGLDKNDAVIRGRLIQKMDFILQGFMPPKQTIDDAEIAAYFKANSQNYQVDATATFTHVFFSKEKRGEVDAMQAAQNLLPLLNRGAVPFEKSGAYGDRFYFLRNYVTKPKRLLSDHFGSEMTAGIFAATPSDRWIGPFTSQYGTHLLLLRALAPSRTPRLAEVQGRVLDDLKRERRDGVRLKAITKLTKKYTLKHSVGAK